MDLLAGRYRLVATLGKGGMGTVWRAVDELLHQEVAVKEVRLPPDLDEAARDQLRERTLREARAAARLRAHPSIVTVHDVVMADGRPWIVMELVRGRSLDQVVREDGPLPPERVAAIGLALLDALSAAHTLGVLHRDVKPANVLLNTGGQVILTDFGIATVTGDATLTQAGMLTGSPGYMAPERLRGEDERPESDLWSLGATLYTAVEGRRAFARDNVPATMAAVLMYEPDPMERAGPLAPVLAGLLDKDPVRRCDGTEAAARLHAVATGTNPGVGNAVPGPGSGPGSGPGFGPGFGPATGPGMGTGGGTTPQFGDATRADSPGSGAVRSGFVGSGAVGSGAVGSGPVKSGFPKGHGAEQTRSRTPLIAGALGAVAVVALATVGAFVMWDGDGAKEKGKPSASTQRTPPGGAPSPAIFTADPTACKLLNDRQAQALLGGRPKRQFQTRGSCLWMRADTGTFVNLSTVRFPTAAFAQTAFDQLREHMKEEPLRYPGTKLRAGPPIGDQSYSYLRREVIVQPVYRTQVLLRTANLVVTVSCSTRLTGYAAPDRTAGFVVAALGSPR